MGPSRARAGSFSPSAPSDEPLFSRDLGNKEMSGVAILDTDNDGRNEIVGFGSPLDLYTLLASEVPLLSAS